MSYSLLDYAAMLRPSPRLDAYVAVLKRHVTPTSLVVDLGAGFGFFAVLAARLGAEHVVAFEPAESIHFGKNLARENGVSDHITWVNGLLDGAALPRPADLIVSDLRGVLPLHTGHLEAMKLARTLLAPGGLLVPARDTLRVCAFDEEKPLLTWTDPLAGPIEGVTLESIRNVTLHQWARGRVDPSALLAAPATWTTLDYRTIEPGRVTGSATLEVTRAGALRGLNVWFDAELASGIGFSNAPDAPHCIYANAIFPVERVVEVSAGARVEVSFGATPVNNDYDWQWHVRAFLPGSDAPVLDERHHTMLSRPLPALVKKLPEPAQ